MTLPLSVLVCSRNRVERLKRCVEAMLAVKASHDWELVIVDNASTDGTANFLSTLSPNGVRPKVTILTEPVPGKGRALNIGWRRAEGQIIAFTDDDCYVTPDYVDAVISAFDRDVGFVGGRVLLFDEGDFPITI